MLEHVVYVLPKKNYFSELHSGSVTHARGVVEGLIQNGLKVTVVAGPGAPAALGTHSDLTVVTIQVGRTNANWATACYRVARQYARKAHATIVRYSVSNAWMATALLRQSEQPWCFEVNSLWCHQQHKVPRALRQRYLPLERRIIGAADVVYCVSQSLQRVLHRLPRVVVIPNGGPEPWRPGIWEMEPRNAKVRYCYLGRIADAYEWDTLLAAYREARRCTPDVSLEFYGNGPLSETLKEQTSNHVGIQFYGEYESDDLAQMPGWDCNVVLVLPAFGAGGRVPVGSPVKLAEYQAMGGAIIAGGVGDVPVELEHGKTALLYAPGDVGSLSRAMVRVAADPTLRRRLGKAAQAVYAKRGTWKHRMARLAEALKTARMDRLQRIPSERTT